MSDKPSAREGVPEGKAQWEAVGRAIKVERTARGWDRRELAERAGLSYPYVSEIENGSKRASSRALFAIAEALGMRSWELLERADSFDPARHEQTARLATSYMAAPARALSTSTAPEGTPRYERAERERALLIADLTRIARDLDVEDLRALRDLGARLARAT